MALLFLDGCSHYTTAADLHKKWTMSPNSNMGISTTNGRRGGGSLTLSSSGAVSKTLPARSTLIAGAAIRINSAPTSTRAILAFWENAVPHICVTLSTTTGKLSVYRGNSNEAGVLLGTCATALNTGVYYYIEVKVVIGQGTTGSVVLRINGSVDLNLSDVDTHNDNAATGIIDRFVLGSSTASGGATGEACDIYVADTTGSANNDFLGDVRVDTLYPNADGFHTQFAPTPSGSHYTAVDETPASSTDYVSSSTVGNKDSFALTDLTSGGAILGVQVNNMMFKDDAGSRSGANLIRSGTSEAQGPAVALSTSSNYNISLHETDPATGAAWTFAAVNALEAGVVVAA